MKKNFKKHFYKQKYIQTMPDGKKIEISIEGDPDEGETTIIVLVEGRKFTTTVDRVDSLPKEYRKVVREVVEKARMETFRERFSLPRSDQPWRDRFEIPDFPWPEWEFFKEDRFRDPMGRLEERIRKLEKQLEAFRDRLDGKKPKDKPEEKEGKTIY